jgi:uncharacterized protein YndB with AHSA1/START domain
LLAAAVATSRCRWGRVLAYEPPHGVVFSWDITINWRIETDASEGSGVGVRVTAESTDGTPVILTHRHVDRHAEGREAMHVAVSSRWSLTPYAEVAAGP